MNPIRFFQSDMTAVLEGHAGGCRLEARLPSRDFGRRVRLAVLWQPRDDRGLPNGPPFLMFEGEAAVLVLPDQDHSRARWEIPLDPSAACDCHFRISRVHDGSPAGC